LAAALEIYVDREPQIKNCLTLLCTKLPIAPLPFFMILFVRLLLNVLTYELLGGISAVAADETVETRYFFLDGAYLFP